MYRLKKIRFFQYILLLLFVIAGSVKATERGDAYTGVNLGISGNIINKQNLGLEKDFSDTSKYMKLPGVGVGIEFEQGWFLAKSFALSGSFGYNFRNINYNIQSDRLGRYIYGYDTLVVANNLLLMMQAFNIDLNSYLYISKKTFLKAGLSYDYYFFSKYYREDDYYLKVNKDDHDFKIYLNSDSPLYDIKDFRTSNIKYDLGIGFDMPVTKRVNLRTTFGFQNHILPMTNNSKSKMLNFYIDFSGQIRHFKKKSKHQTLLDAVTMSTETAGKKTETFIYNRKIRNIRYTLLNSIFFEPDRIEIPDRYYQFKSNNENNFDEAKFQPNDALDAYRRILDIMGSRMVSNPVLKIELYTKSNEEIDSQRKIKISDYLTKIWEISSSRIAIKGSNSEALNDNSVLIVPVQGSESVLMSVLRRDTTEKLLTDRMIFHFDFENTSGIEKWKFNLYSKSDTIISYNGKKNLADVTFDIKQGYNDSILKSNFTFVLLVKGKVGEKDYFIPGKLMVNKEYAENTSDEIYLVWDRPENFDLSYMNRMICQRIKAKDYSANKVTINSYTGKSGNARTSEKISKYRATIVKRETELENAEINYFGENFQIYEFTTPEAEYYNNTVQIIVE